MKIFLDDVRSLPEWAKADGGWSVVRTAKEAIKLLETGEVTEIDLDHDLGTIRTGNDVLLWIEEQFYTNPDFKLPEIHLHTMNPVAYKAMKLAIKNLEKLNHGNK